MEDWAVLIETAANPDDKDADEAIADEARGLMDSLAEFSASASAAARSWSVMLSVDASDPRSAAAIAMEVVSTWAPKVGLPSWPVVKIDTTRADIVDQELERSQLPDFVGTQEVTDLLGISRQRLHQIRSDGRFPDPMLQLAATPVWARPAVEAWAASWDRRPGRPAADARDAIEKMADDVHDRLPSGH